MHVMHVIGDFGLGGAEVGVVRLANALAAKGMRQSVCSFGNDVGAQSLLADNVAFHSLGITGACYMVFLRLYRLLRHENVDVVHVNNLAPWFDAALAARLAGCSCIETFHGLESHAQRFSPVRKKFFWLANKFSCRMTAVSVAASELLADRVNIDLSRIKVIENGVDTEVFAPLSSENERCALRRRLGLPVEGLLFLCVAGLRPVKNHRGLLAAFARICHGNDCLGLGNIFLVLVGDGPLMPELQEMSRRLRIEERIYFLGIRHDIAEILKAGDCFILNSDTEGLSYAVLEAMATGLPVIATAVGANTALIEEGKTGFLAQPGNDSSLEDAVRQLMEQPDDLRSLGGNGRAKVVAEYSLRKMANIYEKMYEEFSR